MESKIKKFISLMWVLVMFNPIIAATLGYLPITPKQLFGYTLLSMAFFGLLGWAYYSIYEISKKYSDFRWQKSDF